MSYTFRGGYIEDESGQRWWSEDLLRKTEKEREQAREELYLLKNEYEIIRDSEMSRDVMAKKIAAQSVTIQKLLNLLYREQ